MVPLALEPGHTVTADDSLLGHVQMTFASGPPTELQA